MAAQSLTLYQIEDHRLALLNSFDLIEDDAEKLECLAEIARAEQAAIAKRDAVIAWRAERLALAAGARTESKRLAEFAGELEKQVEHLDGYLLRVIEQFVPEPGKGARKLEARLGVLSIRKNPDSVEITDESAVPKEFKRIVIETRIDKVSIRKAIQDGAEVPGADLKIGGYRLEVR